MPFTRQEWIDRFVGELRSVIAAIGGGVATTGPSTEAPTDGWVVTLRADQGSRGDLVVEFDRSTTEALTKSIMGLDDPPHEAVVDTLKELCAQAVGSMVLEPPLVGCKLAIVSIEPAAGVAPESVLAQISVEGLAPLPLRLWGDIALVESPLGSSAGGLGQMPAVAIPAPAPAPASARPSLDVILDIDLPLTIRFGKTEMPLRLIAALGPGSVIDLGRSPDDPVDVLVSNQLVARGEVVIVGGNYGVRITDVISPENGIRTLEV
ncbi:MAG: flagellar motor switch protein FliN [Acidobacteriota bacterium]